MESAVATRGGSRQVAPGTIKQDGQIARLAALLNRNGSAEFRQECILRRARGEELPLQPESSEHGPSMGIAELLDGLERQIAERESQNDRHDDYL